jgi:hypothetical protein
MLSVLHRFTDSNYLFGISKIVLEVTINHYAQSSSPKLHVNDVHMDCTLSLKPINCFYKNWRYAHELIDWLVFYANFSNISAISWRDQMLLLHVYT